MALDYQKLDELTGTNVFSEMKKVFEYWGIAEEVINKYKRKYPEKIHRLNNMFNLLCPSGSPSEVTETLYRLHCQELIERVINGIPSRKEDRQAATDAEVMACLMKTSFKVPLNSDAVLLYAELFKKHFGDVPAVEGMEDDFFATHSPSHKDATKDTLNEARRKVAEIRTLDYKGLE